MAITLVRHVSKLAFRLYQPFLSFLLGKVVFWPCLYFHLKVVSRFHLSQGINLPIFSLAPTSVAEGEFPSLDVRRALLFYLMRTARFHREGSLFICFSGPSTGRRAVPQTLPRWLVQTIGQCYELAACPCPLEVHSYSVRVIVF